METVPIGVLTYERPTYLWLTLRSLFGSDLPAGVSVKVFDDASQGAVSRRLYSSPGKTRIDVADNGILDRFAGTCGIADTGRQLSGLSDVVDVIKLGRRPRGVVAASCEAICRLFYENSGACGVILLQDDVVFKPDWYTDLLQRAAAVSAAKPLGVVAGIKLRRRSDAAAEGRRILASGITAQCLYITADCFRRVGFFRRPPPASRKFDDLLRASVTAAGYFVGVCDPPICQHFGFVSKVRPWKQWGRGGRVGYGVSPPYAWCDKLPQRLPVPKNP